MTINGEVFKGRHERDVHSPKTEGLMLMRDCLIEFQKIYDEYRSHLPMGSKMEIGMKLDDLLMALMKTL